MTTNLLMKAAAEIGRQYGQTVTAIQFEDGSGGNYNVQFGKGPWQFVRLGLKWKEDTQQHVEYLKQASETKNIGEFKFFLRQVIADYNRSIATNFDAAMAIAKEEGNQSVINELFNGQHQ